VSRLYGKFRNSGGDFASEFQNMALIGALSTQILHQQFVATTSFRAASSLQPDRVVYGSARKSPGSRSR